MFRIRNSLRRKILLPLLGVLALALTIMAVQERLSFHRALAERLRQRAERISGTIQFIAGAAATPGELQHLVGALGAERDVRMIFVVAGEPARVVASTRMAAVGKPAAELGDSEVEEDMRAALRGTAASSHFNWPEHEFDYFQPISVVLDGPDGYRLERGTVMVSLDIRLLEKQVFATMRDTVLGDVGVLALLAVSCWLLLNRHVLRPVAEIGSAVARFQTGSDARVSVAACPSDEFRGLATAWNGLADSLIREETERRKTEEDRERLLAELQQERKRLADILATVPGLVWEGWGASDSQHAAFASNFVETMLGYRPEEWLAKPNFWLSVVHPDDRERAERETGAIYAGRKGGTTLFRWVHQDGHFVWAESHIVVICDESGTPVGMRGVSLDVTARKVAEAELEDAQKQLLIASREAGMAEVATSVLHNVGNVLNSVNISVGVATEKAGQMKAASLSRLAALLGEHAGNLSAFFASHPQGIRFAQFLGQLAQHFTADQKTMLGELESLRTNVEHINEIVAMQQSYATSGGMIEMLPLGDLVEDALRMNSAAFDRHGTRLVRNFDPSLPPVAVDRNKVLLILVNLIRNAKYACDDTGRADKCITVRTHLNGDGLAKISVSDNGIGIAPENLVRIFEHGFTTRKTGHGFGLHSSALAASEMGGALRVHSGGPGRGASFTIELPLSPDSK
jgi:PAS domain S-box-containing protein